MQIIIRNSKFGILTLTEREPWYLNSVSLSCYRWRIFIGRQAYWAEETNRTHCACGWPSVVGVVTILACLTKLITFSVLRRSCKQLEIVRYIYGVQDMHQILSKGRYCPGEYSRHYQEDLILRKLSRMIIELLSLAI